MFSTEITIVVHCTACDARVTEKEETFYDGLCRSCSYIVAGLIHGELVEYEIPVGLYEDWQATEFEEPEDDVV